MLDTYINQKKVFVRDSTHRGGRNFKRVKQKSTNYKTCDHLCLE